MTTIATNSADEHGTVTDADRDQVMGWIARFERAITSSDAAGVAQLFTEDGNWRDVLALTWDLRTYRGVSQIFEAMSGAMSRFTVHSVSVDDSVPARRVRRAGVDSIEAVFAFTTSDGRGRGVVRLDVHAGGERPKALSVLTSLHGLQGHEERVGQNRPTVSEHSTRFGGPNWLDRRHATAQFEDHDPQVLVVGGGQAGLAVAARLGQLSVDTLVIDREQRIGDNWRNRYHSLVLHNEVWVNHMPYLPFPDTWPTYVPKDKLADWFESYVSAMEINFWTSTELESGDYDSTTERWRVVVRRADGSRRVMEPKHVVMATGVSGIPNRPTISGLNDFSGEIMHSSNFVGGAPYAGKSVFVIGSGNSGHDVAQELQSRGAHVTLVQRSPTTVTSVGPDGAGRVYSLYSEGPSTEDCDLLNISVSYPELQHSYQLLTAQLREQDKPLLDGLDAAGFRWDYGEDSTGFQMKYLRRGGGYYLNVGCSDLIVDGRVKLVQYDSIDHFDTRGVRFKDGKEQVIDLVVLATGYKAQQELVRQLFGSAIADRVGSIWGFDEEGELRNMWKRTAQPGLWFTAGSLAQCRIFSKFLALQIKACEIGMLPVRRQAAGSVC